jgi:hypothetical protein
MLAVTLDLSAAFLSVPVDPSQYNLLMFRMAGRLFHYKALPFGTAASPALFQRYLRDCLASVPIPSDVLPYWYVDDHLSLSHNRESLIRFRDDTISRLEACGFSVNREKSLLEPSTVFSYLSHEFNTEEMTIRIDPDKVPRYTAAVDDLLRMSRAPSIRQVWAVLGKLNYLRHVVVNLKEVTAPLHAAVTLARQGQRFPKANDHEFWDRPAPLPPAALDSLLFIRSRLASLTAPLSRATLVIAVDSSFRASGFIIDGVAHRVPLPASHDSSGAAELRGVLEAITTALRITPAAPPTRIIILSDSVTAVSAVNNTTSQSEDISRILRQILQATAGITLQARHLPAADLALPDFISRRSTTAMDVWTLTDAARQWIATALDVPVTSIATPDVMGEDAPPRPRRSAPRVVAFCPPDRLVLGAARLAAAVTAASGIQHVIVTRKWPSRLPPALQSITTVVDERSAHGLITSHPRSTHPANPDRWILQLRTPTPTSTQH